MTKRFTLYLGSLVLTSVLLGACSRPVAYFQPEKRVNYATSSVAVAAKTDVIAQPVASVEVPVAVASVVEPSTSTNAAVNQLEAYVRNDTKLADNKQFNKRVERLKNQLSASATHETVATTASVHKASLLERLMVKKLNKKISKHLAPDSPKKPMINGGLLAGGAVLLLVGLLLMILGSGTGATIGLIVAIVGLLGLIFGLLAS